MTVKMSLDPRTMPDGVVLILNVRFTPQEDQRANPTIYSYAALKSHGFWYVTGSRAPQVAGWGAVEAWLERDNRELVSVEIQTGTRTIWPEPEPVATLSDIIWKGVPVVVQGETGPEEHYGDDSPGPKIDTPQA